MGMGQYFLRVIRGCLALLAFITIIMTAHFVRLYPMSILRLGGWLVWLPLLLAIFSVIVYIWAIWAQSTKRNIIPWNGVRYIGSLILFAAWLTPPSYGIHNTLEYLGRYNRTEEFFAFWNCGRPDCSLWFVIDICGFLMALLVLLEMILTYRYERSSNVRKADTLPTATVSGAGHVQQNSVNVQQQPDQPAVYYPPPRMTAPYQSYTTPHKEYPAAAPYQVSATGTPFSSSPYSNPQPTTLLVGPAPIQQQLVHQYVYGRAQQLSSTNDDYAIPRPDSTPQVSQQARVYQHSPSTTNTYGWVLKTTMAQKCTLQSQSARYACSFLLCVAWLVSPCHVINTLLGSLRKYASEDKFFTLWTCGTAGNPFNSWCKLRFGIDLCGFLMALLVFLEVTFTYLNERSLDAADKADTLPTTMVAAPGPGQQY
ncbi:MAG: hypothetical protein J3Q66DRAFT_371754 [Benniella sp.]|nr:MAG: hypothetical protein J3Q66DRAFT_371754 [Benniella sp.]